MAKKKRKKFAGIQCILITSIIALNLVGLTYAKWNEGLTINTSIFTGDIDPMFTQLLLDEENGKGKLNFRLDEKTVYVNGEVETNYNALLKYGIQNKGSLPVKYNQRNAVLMSAINNYSDNGIDFLINESSKVLMPSTNNYKREENLMLHINARNKGEYDFELKIPFRQWVNE